MSPNVEIYQTSDFKQTNNTKEEAFFAKHHVNHTNFVDLLKTQLQAS